MTTGIAGFSEDTFTHDGITHTVFRKGSGPAVIVMAEIPGITPKVLEFAERVVDLGCTVVLPQLFGEPGRDISVPYALKSISKGCVSREFTVLARGQASPVTVWLRALARHEHAACGGPGVGAVGMCFTGGFALAMMVDPSVVAPVLSQPSLPFAIGRKGKRDLGISDADIQKAKARMQDEGIWLLGLRFTGDTLVPKERFDRMREEFGSGFVAVELDSSPGNPDGFRKKAHSVLTEDLVDVEGNSSRDALNQVLDLFRSRLLEPAT